MCRLCRFVFHILVSLYLFVFLIYLYFVQRKKHFIFVGFLFQSLIFCFNCNFIILHNFDYFPLQIYLYFCGIVIGNNTYYGFILNFKVMLKHIYKHFNYLRVYYDNGSFDFSKDSSDKIWDRFRKLSQFFVDNPWSGIHKIEICDNAERVIMSVINHLIK